MRRRLMAGLGVLTAVLAFSVPATAPAHDFDRVGTVYTINNSLARNDVFAYTRAADGSLSLLGTYGTGGTGTGVTAPPVGLGSQGSMTLSPDGHWLAAIGAGSNDVALFAVSPDGSLYLSSNVFAGGMDPISVTIHGPFVYVLDAGGNGKIAGFVNLGAHLVALPGSIQPLSPLQPQPSQRPPRRSPSVPTGVCWS